jgi:hypothetical protein
LQLYDLRGRRIEPKAGWTIDKRLMKTRRAASGITIAVASGDCQKGQYELLIQ